MGRLNAPLSRDAMVTGARSDVEQLVRRALADLEQAREVIQPWSDGTPGLPTALDLEQAHTPLEVASQFVELALATIHGEPRGPRHAITDTLKCCLTAPEHVDESGGMKPLLLMLAGEEVW